jgi:hypothetical protein
MLAETRSLTLGALTRSPEREGGVGTQITDPGAGPAASR